MRKALRVLALVMVSGMLMAALPTTITDLKVPGKFWLPSGTSLPATCTVGQFFLLTTDSTLHWCSATNTWTQAGGGGQLNWQQTKIVAKSGGQYTTITAALASYSDHSATKQYEILVGLGNYDEIVTAKSWTTIRGMSRTGTRLRGLRATDYRTVLIDVGVTEFAMENLTVGGYTPIAFLGDDRASRTTHYFRDLDIGIIDSTAEVDDYTHKSADCIYDQLGAGHNIFLANSSCRTWYDGNLIGKDSTFIETGTQYSLKAGPGGANSALRIDREGAQVYSTGAVVRNSEGSGLAGGHAYAFGVGLTGAGGSRPTIMDVTGATIDLMAKENQAGTLEISCVRIGCNSTVAALPARFTFTGMNCSLNNTDTGFGTRNAYGIAVEGVTGDCTARPDTRVLWNGGSFQASVFPGKIAADTLNSDTTPGFSVVLENFSGTGVYAGTARPDIPSWTPDKTLQPLRPLGLVTLDFEDGGDNHYDYVAPTLEKYGFRGMFAVPIGKVGLTGQMTTVELKETIGRGHELVSTDYDDAPWGYCTFAYPPCPLRCQNNWNTVCTTSADCAGNPCNPSTRTVDSIVSNVKLERDWVQSNLGIDHLRHHSTSNGDDISSWPDLWSSWCYESQASESQMREPPYSSGKTPCRQGLGMMFYDSIRYIGSGFPVSLSPSGSLAELPLYVPVSGVTVAEVLEFVKQVTTGGSGGAWLTIAYHNITINGGSLAQENIGFEQILAYLKSEQDKGNLRVVTTDEAISIIHGPEPRNLVQNPSMAHKMAPSADQVPYWRSELGTPPTGTFLKYQPDTDWPGRNEAIFSTDYGPVGEMMGLKRGSTYVLAVLVKVTGTITGGQGIFMRLDNARGWGADFGSGLQQANTPVQPGNGTNSGNLIGHWQFGTWGLVWTKFKADTPWIPWTLGTDLQCADSGYGGNTGGGAAGDYCQVQMRYPVAFPVGQQDREGASSIREDAGRPRLLPFVRVKSSQVVPGSGSLCIVGEFLTTFGSSSWSTYPQTALINRVSLDRTAGAATLGIKAEFFGSNYTNGCVGTLHYPLNIDSAGNAQAIAGDPWIQLGATYIRDDRADGLCTHGPCFPLPGTASNKWFLKLTNLDAVDLTYTVTVEGVTID